MDAFVKFVGKLKDTVGPVCQWLLLRDDAENPRLQSSSREVSPRGLEQLSDLLWSQVSHVHPP